MIGKQRLGRKFGLRELGLLDGPPQRGALTIVEAAKDLLGCHQVTFFVFDDLAATARVHASSNANLPGYEFPIANSLCAQIRLEDRMLAFETVADEAPGAPERSCLNAEALLGTPVYGPDTEAAGVLIATHLSSRAWTPFSRKRLENFAHLVSQEIMLRASFETLKIMWTERSALNA